MQRVPAFPSWQLKMSHCGIKEESPCEKEVRVRKIDTDQNGFLF